MSDMLGAVSPALGAPITVEHLVRYAGASGDFNPLHYDAAIARAAGFDDVVVVGALSASMLMVELERAPHAADLRRYSVRFLAPVLVGAVLDAETRAASEAGATAVEAGVTVNGAPVIEAHAQFGGAGADLDVLPEDFTALGEAFRWIVEEGSARDFAAAIGDPRRIGPASLVSPTYLQSAMRWSPSARDLVQRLDFDFARIVHGGSTFEYGSAPIRVGEELRIVEGHSGRKAVDGRSGRLQLADAHLLIQDTDGRVRARVAHHIVERPPQ